MNSLPEDILANIFAKLPIKIFTTFKLVCKQWESIVESPYFRDLFLSIHQTSHSSSWSLLSCCIDKQVIANYGCNTWGLERSLGSYISYLFETLRNKYKVWAHSTDVGLILISELFFNMKNRSLYVANPVSQECVEIPSHHAHRIEYFYPLGIATRSENGVLLDYKVVLFDTYKSLMIYSSKTNLWSLNTVDLSVSCIDLRSTICLHGSIHLIATTSHGEDVVVSFNLYATGTSSVQCRVTSFPDFGQHRPDRSFSTWQGSIMYMNIISVTKDDGSLEDKLFVWRLESGEWQLVFEIATPFIETRVEYFPLAINPFDAKTVYFWSKKHRSFISIKTMESLCSRVSWKITSPEDYTFAWSFPTMAASNSQHSENGLDNSCMTSLKVLFYFLVWLVPYARAMNCRMVFDLFPVFWLFYIREKNLILSLCSQRHHKSGIMN